jgi:hypothetical protein
MHQNGKVVFPSCQQLVKDVLLNIVTKVTKIHVFPTLAWCVSSTISFDLWMSCASYDTFVMMVSFINDACHLNHITIGLLEVQNTIGVYMTK